jgi:ABC-type molybdate transport system substrate-binding protein
MPAWSKEDLRKIAESDDLHVSPLREDGVTHGTPTWIWSVALDNALYVRAYHGPNSRWYQAAMRQKAVPATDCFVLGGSSIAVAVPAGRPKPEVSSAERLKRALLAANAVAYTNPASGGPSEIQFAKVLEHLGIAEEVRPKTKFPPPGGLVGQILAREEADIGVQQSTELSSFRGVEVIGFLPSEFQIVTEYSAAIPTNSPNPEGAKALIEFMRSAEGRAAMKAKGLVPK